MILAEGDAGRQGADGHQLRYFDVFRGSHVLMESVRSVRLKKFGNKSALLRNLHSKGRTGPLGSGNDPQRGPNEPGVSALMGWDDIIAGFLISLAAGLVIEGGKALWDELTEDDDDICYDPDEDVFFKCND